MAPITDQLVDELKNTISKLESRVQELEARLHGGKGAASSSPESMRMILIGPPGAGTSPSVEILPFGTSQLAVIAPFQHH